MSVHETGYKQSGKKASESGNGNAVLEVFAARIGAITQAAGSALGEDGAGHGVGDSDASASK
jgi:hypothetical protein